MYGSQRKKNNNAINSNRLHTDKLINIFTLTNDTYK